MYVMIQTLSDMPDATRFLFAQTPAGHILFTILDHFFRCYEDFTCSL